MDDFRKKLSQLTSLRIVFTVICFGLSVFLLFRLFRTQSTMLQILFLIIIFLSIWLLVYFRLAFFPAKKIFKTVIWYTEPYKLAIALLFVFVPLVFYILSSSSPTTVPPINVDIIDVAGILGGFSLTAAVFPKVDRRMRGRLFVVALLFAIATALLVIGALNLQSINLQGGINLAKKQFDSQGVARWYTYWLTVVGFYGGTLSFAYAIIDLLFVIANLAGLKKQPPNKRKGGKSNKMQQNKLDGIKKIKEKHLEKWKGISWGLIGDAIKNTGQNIGWLFMVLGGIVLIVDFFLRVLNKPDSGLLDVFLGLVSVGLGFIAIGMAHQTDKKYTNILTKLDINLTKVLHYFEPETDELKFPPNLSNNVVISPPPMNLKMAFGSADVATRFEVTTPEISKAKAQNRLEQDTKEVGYVRGELFQKTDGSWGIRWGGKYPL